MESQRERMTGRQMITGNKREAVAAGKRAESIAKDVKNSLDSAEGWGAWDILDGGMVGGVCSVRVCAAAYLKKEAQR